MRVAVQHGGSEYSLKFNRTSFPLCVTHATAARVSAKLQLGKFQFTAGFPANSSNIEHGGHRRFLPRFLEKKVTKSGGNFAVSNGPRNFRKLLEWFACDVIARGRSQRRQQRRDATRRGGIVLNSFTCHARAASSRSRSFTGNSVCSQCNVYLLKSKISQWIRCIDVFIILMNTMYEYNIWIKCTWI